jgi:low affinity Fe/Cu permease
MARKRNVRSHGWLERAARRVTDWSGTSLAFAGAVAVVVAWALLGPVFHFSDTWQLVINTGTTIVTFLMVFLIQRSQNKDSQALHLKLNEIVAAVQGASNRLINVEDLTEQEVQLLHRHYQRLAELAKRDAILTESHSTKRSFGFSISTTGPSRGWRSGTGSSPSRTRSRKPRRARLPKSASADISHQFASVVSATTS